MSRSVKSGSSFGSRGSSSGSRLSSSGSRGSRLSSSGSRASSSGSRASSYVSRLSSSEDSVSVSDSEDYDDYGNGGDDDDISDNGDDISLSSRFKNMNVVPSNIKFAKKSYLNQLEGVTSIYQTREIIANEYCSRVEGNSLKYLTSVNKKSRPGSLENGLRNSVELLVELLSPLVDENLRNEVLILITVGLLTSRYVCPLANCVFKHKETELQNLWNYNQMSFNRRRYPEMTIACDTFFSSI